MATASPFLPASMLGKELAAVAGRLQRITVRIRASAGGAGSGVIWRPDGLVVTNAHVATAASHEVALPDGTSFTAQLLRRDVRCDLAALQIPAEGLASAEARDPCGMRPGEMLLAVGHPLGEVGAFAAGMLAARPRPRDAFLRADIRLAPGNSGGPLADAAGRVVGVNSMIFDGFGIAVTTSAVERFLAGSPRRLGVTVQPVPVRAPGMAQTGLLIVALEAGGVAHLSGLLVGDIIVRGNRRSLGAPEDLAELLQAPGEALAVEVLRGSQWQELEMRFPKEQPVGVT